MFLSFFLSLVGLFCFFFFYFLCSPIELHCMRLFRVNKWTFYQRLMIRGTRILFSRPCSMVICASTHKQTRKKKKQIANERKFPSTTKSRMNFIVVSFLSIIFFFFWFVHMRIMGLHVFSHQRYATRNTIVFKLMSSVYQNDRNNKWTNIFMRKNAEKEKKKQPT